jgi:hypothetical protein
MTGSTAKEPSTVEAQMAQISARPLARWPERFPEARPFGYLNSHVPGEILHAAGFTPLHVFGNRRPPRPATARRSG